VYDFEVQDESLGWRHSTLGALQKGLYHFGPRSYTLYELNPICKSLCPRQAQHNEIKENRTKVTKSYD